jgi:hypothetical protein
MIVYFKHYLRKLPMEKIMSSEISIFHTPVTTRPLSFEAVVRNRQAQAPLAAASLFLKELVDKVDAGTKTRLHFRTRKENLWIWN